MARTAAGSGAGRPRSPRGQGEELRTEILAAVNRLLAEWGGVDKLTMRAVANEVGTTAGSIYLHFTDKTELVWAALSDKYAELAARMAEADAGAVPDGARERLRAQTHAYCRFGLEHPGHYRLMYEVRQPEVDVARISRHPSRLISESLRQGFIRCREAGFGWRCRSSSRRRRSGKHYTVSCHWRTASSSIHRPRHWCWNWRTGCSTLSCPPHPTMIAGGLRRRIRLRRATFGRCLSATTLPRWSATTPSESGRRLLPQRRTLLTELSLVTLAN